MREREVRPPEAPLNPPEPQRPTIVGIEASAGGLNALEQFVAAVPRDSGLAYVVVIPRASHRESHVADLLQPHSRIPVLQVTETTPLEPNRVYVIAPDRGLSVVDSHLRVMPLETARRDRAPVDALRDVTALKRTAAEIRGIEARLEARIAERTAERDALRRALTLAEEAERRRLARELHDEAGQQLTAIGLGPQALSDVVPPNSEADRRAAQLRKLAEGLARELHALAVRLRPKSLDDFGLEAALVAFAEGWAAQSGIAVNVHAATAAERLSPEIESAVYRIVQEALTNVAKHSGAHRTSVVVERRDDHLVVVVADDGKGFDVRAAMRRRAAAQDGGNTRLGLLGVRERAALLGGTVDVESAPGDGTTVLVRIPLSTPPVTAAAHV